MRKIYYVIQIICREEKLNHIFSLISVQLFKVINCIVPEG